MSFSAILPVNGYSGWRFLQKTLHSQKAIMEKSPQEIRIVDYFKSNIKNVKSAQDLVDDRRLLNVALSAFGLEGDLNNKYFIKKILEDGVTERGALANRLSDKRYREFAKAFKLDSPKSTSYSDKFVNSIISKYHDKRFESAVGQQDNDIRLALNVKNNLKSITEATKNQNAQWYSVLGNPPLRAVIEKALNLPPQIARINVDKQLQTFKESAQKIFKTDNLEDLSSAENQEKLIRLFLVRSSLQANQATSSGNIALTLLRSP